MKISSKINFLILISILALFGISTISEVFRSQELQYYLLVEEIKELDNRMLNALVRQKDFGKNSGSENTVFEALDTVENKLIEIDQSLLEENAFHLESIGGLLGQFREAFSQMSNNTQQLKTNRARINQLANLYSEKQEQVTRSVDNDFFLNQWDAETSAEEQGTAFQEFNVSSLQTSTLINRLLILVNQELLLDGKVEYFEEKSQFVLDQMQVQEQNLHILNGELEGKHYQALVETLTSINQEVSPLLKAIKISYEENVLIAQALEAHEQEIKKLTQKITEHSESIRQEKNQVSTNIKFFGEALIVVFLLIGGVVIARSIAHPLSVLTHATEVMNLSHLERLKSGRDEEEKLLQSKDEFGMLARSFEMMRSAIVLRIEEIEEKNESFREKELILAYEDLKKINQSLEETVTLRTDELTLAQSQLEEKHHNLQEAQAQLVQSTKMTGLGNLVSGMMHEINNPMNFVSAGVHNLKAELEGFKAFIFEIAGDEASSELIQHFEAQFEKFFEFIETVNSGSIRIKTLVSDLRTFSHMDQAEQKSVKIVPGLISTLRLIQAQYSKQLDVVCELNADVQLKCWPAQLNQAFMNIIENACESVVAQQKQSDNEQPGKLTIRSEKDEKNFLLSFQDTGCGMSEDVQNKMFEPFFTTKTVGEGMGLGMSVAYGIIKKHQGLITIDSAIDAGTTVTISLPIE